jgi:hypothetical protein
LWQGLAGPEDVDKWHGEMCAVCSGGGRTAPHDMDVAAHSDSVGLTRNGNQKVRTQRLILDCFTAAPTVGDRNAEPEIADRIVV